MERIIKYLLSVFLILFIVSCSPTREASYKDRAGIMLLKPEEYARNKPYKPSKLKQKVHKVNITVSSFMNTQRLDEPFYLIESNVIAKPTVTTSTFSNITQNSSIVGGNVTNSGGAPVTERGIFWGLSQNPESTGTKMQIGSGTGSYSATLSGLLPGTIYYVNAYATNSKGTAYGKQVSFSTQNSTGTGIIFNSNLTYGSISDIEANVYKTIKIGTQTWMAENLKTVKYNDGSSIPLVTDGGVWIGLSAPGFCWYGNDAVTHKSTYGALYNWYATNTGMLCPTGWHIPTEAEWGTLESYLNGGMVAGGKLKETGISHWLNPNTSATNESGFTSIPGGYRVGDGYGGAYSGIGENGYWWSASEISTTSAWGRNISYNFNMVTNIGDFKRTGYSVRCIQGGSQPLLVINTEAVTNITNSTAICGGNITSDGGSAVIARGVCWSTSQNPTIANNKTTNGSGTGGYISNLTGLSATTTYYVRAYATNNNGTVYGNQVSFTTTEVSQTINIQPGPEGKDASIILFSFDDCKDLYNHSGDDSVIIIENDYWGTCQKQVDRMLIQFPLNQIPTNSTITSAQLEVYGLAITHTIAIPKISLFRVKSV